MTNLTDELSAATRTIHGISDKLVNLKLAVALTEKELYGRALMLFYYIYVQLESTIQRHKTHKAFSGLYELFDEFARADGIAKDLYFYLGENWMSKYQPTPAVHDYVKHLQELEKKDPILVLPYFYHMYMAMLAGGMIIKKMVQRSFTLPEKQGLNSFSYHVENPKVTSSNLIVQMYSQSLYVWQTLCKSIKDKINAVPHDAETKKLLLVESVTCFKRNNQVVRSLDGAGRRLFTFLLKWTIVLGLFIAVSLLWVIYEHPDAIS
ncbi:hypothetical protein PsorP6_006488 [Peronosclerospora sorghi]|uniref:Uncharacterized protein n=1 Tax=Peronosclerospora sorghi TaxID=230839 RepID=A0ACC0W4N5_9STRA|nr:hypothetical protein PsorP6_006488 [Peronosclerospora sorghi]